MNGLEIDSKLFLAAHVVLYIIEGLYFCCLLTPKIKRPAFWALYVVSNFAMALPGMIWIEQKVFFAPVYYILRTLFICLINKDKKSKKAMAIIMMYVFMLFSEIMGISFMSIWNFKSATVMWMIEYALVYIVYSILLFMFAYFLKTLDAYNVGKKSFLFIMLPVSQLLFLNALLIFDNLNDLSQNIALKVNYNTNLLFTAYFIITMIISLIIDVAVFKGFVENLKLHDTQLKLKALEYQNMANLRYYTDLQENTKSMRKIKHDFLNILQIMYGFNGNSDSYENKEKADLLYNELEDRIKNIRFEDYCSNNLVNAILASKVGECADDGVKFEIKAALSENLPIKDFDLCRALVNMLDNAIEACRRIECIESRKILFEIFEREGYLYIKTQNPNISETGLSFEKTAKQDKKEHGFGLEILKDIASDYDGEFVTVDGDEIFTAMLTLALKQ